MGETTRPVTSGTPEDIRREIGRTQARMDETLNEIEDRLAPRRVYERTREAAEDGLRRAGRATGDAARRTADRAERQGRALARRVDQVGRGRTIAGAAAGVAALWYASRLWRRRRTVDETTPVPAHADWERPFLQSGQEPPPRRGLRRFRRSEST